MTTYIAFLRGINVGGHRVTMAQLKKIFELLGFDNVHTYIQSGNISFDAKSSHRTSLQTKIEERLLQELGYKVPTMLRTIPELEKTLAGSPFASMQPKPHTRHFIMFCAGELPKNLDFPTYSPKKDFEIVGAQGNDLSLILDLNIGKPGNPALFIEKTFKMVATSRFYHTTAKIVQAVKEHKGLS